MTNLTTPALNLKSELVGIGRKSALDLVRVPSSNLIKNGEFTTDITGWTPTIGGAVSFSSGQIVVDNNGSTFRSAEQMAHLTVGADFQFTADVIANANGRLVVSSQPANETLALSGTGVGTQQAAFVATPQVALRMQVSSATPDATSTFDNAMLWEIDRSDGAPWLRLPSGHRVGKRGKVVRDGLELMEGDYEECLTGIGPYLQSFIKPLTAPGPNTRFNVHCKAEGLL